MDYFQIGDTLDYNKYNGLVYLLRKSRRLRTNITLGEKNIIDKYGTFRFIGDFTNINGNYILEEDVNIYADDVYKNATYTFIFNAINIDTSEEIHRRIIYKECDTGDDGILNITLPNDMLGENEVILSSVTVDIYFSTHESQNSLNSFKVSLDVEKTYLTSGTNTITLTILEPDDTPVDNVLTTIYINNTPHQVTTDANGEATYTYIYTGTEGKVTVRSNGATAIFYDGGIDFAYNQITSSSGVYSWVLKLGYNSQLNKGESWLPSNDEVKLICETNNNQWILNNPKTTETFNSQYTSADPITEVNYKIFGDVIAIGADMFDSCYGLTEINIPRGIERIDKRAFYYATNLESITIPDTVYSLGALCFYNTGIEEIRLPRSINYIGSSVFDKCKIKKYKLSWIENEIIPYTANRFPIIDETIFKIPYGETANYIAKNYPSDRLEEIIMADTITLTGTPIIQTGDTDTITATLLYGSTPVSGETLSYQVKHGSTVLDSGSGTTDSNGQISISYTGTGIGDVDIIVSYGSDIQETFEVQDCKFYDDMSSNKLSQYITKIGSVTSTYQSGYIQIQGTSNFCGLAPNIELDSSDDWSMECEIKTNSNTYNGVLLLKNNTDFISNVIYDNNYAYVSSYGYASYNYPYTGDSNWLFRDTSLRGNSNTWYKFKMKLISNTIYYYLYNSNGDLLTSKTVSLPSKYQNTDIYFTPLTEGSSTAQFRNVKIKAL